MSGPEHEPAPPPPRGPGSRRRRALFFAIAAVVAVAIVVAFRAVLLPFVLALLIAYVFAPVVAWMEKLRVRGRPVPRWVHVLALYVALLGALAGGVAFGAPRLGAELQRFGQGLPRIVREIEDEWVPSVEQALNAAMQPYLGSSGTAREPGGTADAPAAPLAESPRAAPGIRVVPRSDGSYDVSLPADGVLVRPGDDGGWVVATSEVDDAEPASLPQMLRQAGVRAARSLGQYAGDAIKAAQTLVRAVVRGIFLFFLTLMLSAYLLITQARVLDFFRGLVRPEQRDSYDRLLHRVDRGLAGVVRGQLVICVVNGVLSGIGFWLLGLDYWPVLTLIATVLSIIPIFGAILSSIPAVLVALHDGFGTAVLALLWIVGIHQLEANLLNPKIMGDAAKVHPVLVVFSLLAGEHFFGVTGALLAVPTLSIVQSLFLHFRTVALGDEAAPPTSGSSA